MNAFICHPHGLPTEKVRQIVRDAGFMATAPKPDDIRAAREAAGLTQTQSARLIHASLRGWQDWEAGRRRMHPAFWELFRIKTKTCADHRNAT